MIGQTTAHYRVAAKLGRPSGKRAPRFCAKEKAELKASAPLPENFPCQKP